MNGVFDPPSHSTGPIKVAEDGREFMVRELRDDVAPLNMGVIHLENDNMTTSASELMAMLIEVLK